MYQSDALVRALWLTDNYLIDSHIEAKNLKAGIEARMEKISFFR
jgi:hypothetical protein